MSWQGSASATASIPASFRAYDMEPWLLAPASHGRPCLLLVRCRCRKRSRGKESTHASPSSTSFSSSPPARAKSSSSMSDMVEEYVMDSARKCRYSARFSSPGKVLNRRERVKRRRVRGVEERCRSPESRGNEDDEGWLGALALARPRQGTTRVGPDFKCGDITKPIESRSSRHRHRHRHLDFAPPSPAKVQHNTTTPGIVAQWLHGYSHQGPCPAMHRKSSTSSRRSQSHHAHAHHAPLFHHANDDPKAPPQTHTLPPPPAPPLPTSRLPPTTPPSLPPHPPPRSPSTSSPPSSAPSSPPPCA